LSLTWAPHDQAKKTGEYAHCRQVVMGHEIYVTSDDADTVIGVAAMHASDVSFQ
jgi:hypothetical protein